jgi:hypothetical protein
VRYGAGSREAKARAFELNCSARTGSLMLAVASKGVHLKAHNGLGRTCTPGGGAIFVSRERENSEFSESSGDARVALAGNGHAMAWPYSRRNTLCGR